MICAYGENTVSQATWKRWYQNFAKEILNLEDELDALKKLKWTASIAEYKLYANWKGVCCLTLRGKPFPYVYMQWEKFRRKADGFRINCPKTIKIDGITPHSVCFQSSGKKDFLHKIITGDEKWILYDNPKRKSWVDPQSSTSKAKAQYPRQ